jgi:hypothetical protein
MASTYTWANALTVIAPYVKSIPTTTLDATVCDQINSFIWKAYPWRWAQATLTSASGVLTLVDGTQDYGIGTTTGGGFYQLLRARITRYDVTPNVVREKNIVNWLAPNLESKGGVDGITTVCYEPISGGFRLDRAAEVPSGVTLRLDGEYWFQPTKITLTSSTIVFPDSYFDVAIEGLKWKYYQLGDDSRANDQRAVFISALELMKREEDYGDAPGARFPEEGLGVR